jgi:general nucleoside transport system permease protein
MTMLERLPQLRRWLLLAMGLLLVFDVFSWLSGDAPAAALVRGLAGTWGTAYGIGQVLFKATPLLFSGIAFDMALRAGLFNIGTEGQLAVASLVVGLVGSRLPAGLSPWISLPLMLSVGMVSGALWASPAAVLRARFGGHEVIATIMLNRIADALIPFALASGWGKTEFRTADVVLGARLSRMEHYWKVFHGSALSTSLLLALLVVGAVRWFQVRSRWGREIRWVGLGAEASQAAGVPVVARITLALMLSGALAGLVSSATVLGYKGYYEVGLGAGTGFAGVAVALLGQGRVVGMVLAALFVGTLQQAGLVLNATIPKEVMDILFGVAILVVAATSHSGPTSEPTVIQPKGNSPS